MNQGVHSGGSERDDDNILNNERVCDNICTHTITSFLALFVFLIDGVVRGGVIKGWGWLGAAKNDKDRYQYYSITT